MYANRCTTQHRGWERVDRQNTGIFGLGGARTGASPGQGIGAGPAVRPRVVEKAFDTAVEPIGASLSQGADNRNSRYVARTTSIVPDPCVRLASLRVSHKSGARTICMKFRNTHFAGRIRRQEQRKETHLRLQTDYLRDEPLLCQLRLSSASLSTAE